MFFGRSGSTLFHVEYERKNGMSGWYDTHCHLTVDEFHLDRYDVLQRCKDVNVKGIITLGIDVQSSRFAQNLADLHSNVFFCAGIHPHDADRCNVRDFESQLQAMWNHPKCVAVGEIGLDNFRDYSKYENQRNNFTFQLRCAMELSKPIVIHNRNTSKEILDCLDEVNYTGTGVWHCFSGDVELAKEVIERGFYISIAGNITYENSPLQDVVKVIPLDKLLIETDAPWLAPMPKRKQRNEPSYVALTGSYIANLLQVEENIFQNQLAENTKRLFQFK